MTGKLHDKLHRRDKPEEPVGVEYEPSPERETKPAPKEEDIGGDDVCPKCGRKGRAPGHH